MTPDPLARRRALWAARAILERYAFTPGRPYDPVISMVLDAIAAAEQEDAAMTDRLDHPSCSACGKPCDLIPMSEVTRPRAANEPDPPIRLFLHEHCDQPGVASMIMMERMARAGLLWPPPAAEDAA